MPISGLKTGVIGTFICLLDIRFLGGYDWDVNFSCKKKKNVSQSSKEIVNVVSVQN